jgi:hypothetical protein
VQLPVSPPPFLKLWRGSGSRVGCCLSTHCSLLGPGPHLRLSLPTPHTLSSKCSLVSSGWTPAQDTCIWPVALTLCRNAHPWGGRQVGKRRQEDLGGEGPPVWQFLSNFPAEELPALELVCWPPCQF